MAFTIENLNILVALTENNPLFALFTLNSESNTLNNESEQTLETARPGKTLAIQLLTTKLVLIPKFQPKSLKTVSASVPYMSRAEARQANRFTQKIKILGIFSPPKVVY